MDSKQKDEEMDTQTKKKEEKKKRVAKREESDDWKPVGDGETKKRGRKRRADKEEGVSEVFCNSCMLEWLVSFHLLPSDLQAKCQSTHETIPFCLRWHSRIH